MMFSTAGTGDAEAARAEIIHHVSERLGAFGKPGAPAITLAYAQSLDGSIAAEPGAATLISNDTSKALTHGLRAIHDAILVGINTVLVDNPRLTTRLVKGPDPMPIVVDSNLRMPLDSLLMQGAKKPLIATSESAPEERERALIDGGATVVRLGKDCGGVCLRQLFTHLGQRGLNSIMVEGGARVITTMLAYQLSHHLVLTVAPRFLGGVPSVHRFSQKECSALEAVRCYGLDGDLLLCADFAYPKDEKTTGREPEPERSTSL